ncbi:MAG: hypothetical protein ACLRFN_04670 [Alphaproteobacteria bacterium]|nr:hypothetical protein [Alphaproteobacteria bacterium]
MKFNFRTFFLKSLPYLMSITGGIILYTGAIDNAPNANLRDLIINVSASLLSIPLVFLLYDYTNSRVARQMKKNLANSMSDRLNILMLNIILMLREMMGVRTKLNTENLNRMLMWRVPEISRRLKITTKTNQELREYHNELDTLLYRNGQNDVINSDVFQTLSALSREMTRLINESKFRRNKRLSAKYVEGIMARILDWLDSDSVAALNLQKHISAPSENLENK